MKKSIVWVSRRRCIAHTRRSSYEQVEGYLKSLYPDSYQTDAFRHGYERGQSYCRSLTVAPINHRSRN